MTVINGGFKNFSYILLSPPHFTSVQLSFFWICGCDLVLIFVIFLETFFPRIFLMMSQPSREWNPLWEMTATLTLQICKSLTTLASFSIYTIFYALYLRVSSWDKFGWAWWNNQSNCLRALANIYLWKIVARETRWRSVKRRFEKNIIKKIFQLNKKISRNINYWRTLISFHLTTMKLWEFAEGDSCELCIRKIATWMSYYEYLHWRKWYKWCEIVGH